MNYQKSYIAIPPWLPIPGTSIVHGDRREVVSFDLPSYMGHSFTELCRLTPIINEILLQHYDNGDKVAPVTRTSFGFAENVYQQLLAWANSLPIAMAPGADMPYHVAVVQ